MKETIVEILIQFGLYFVICFGQGQSSATILVYRRQSFDIYELSSNDGEKRINCETNQTYIVDDRKCLKNEDLFKECGLVLGENATLLPRLYAVMSKQHPGVWTVINKESRELVNTSFCQTISLKVYRGQDNAIEISHSGFSLLDRGTIKVNIHQLAYNVSEYQGELFQLKLSCPTEGKSQEECLFFKVIGKSTILTEPKFNCIVPGTLSVHSAECSTNHPKKIEPTIVSELKTTTEATQLYKTTTIYLFSVTTEMPSNFKIGGRLFYIVVGAVGLTFALLILCSLCVCCVLICRQKRPQVSAITSTDTDRKISTISKQIEATNGKDLELHLYEVPGNLMPAMYGCNCLEVNQAYLEPTGKRGKSEIKQLDCNFSDNDGQENGEPLYQEIIPKLELSTEMQSRSKRGLNFTTTVENDLYLTSIL